MRFIGIAIMFVGVGLLQVAAATDSDLAGWTGVVVAIGGGVMGVAYAIRDSR